MSKKKQQKLTKAKSSQLTRYIITNFLFDSIVFTGCFLLIIFFLIFLCNHHIWYKTDLIYNVLKLVQENIYYFFIFFWMAGIIVLLMIYWRRILGYMDHMVQAGKQLVSDEDELIKFPLELKEIEEQMNQVKQEAMKNSRIAKEEEKRKNDLIVYLAHDLKTPLTSVIGYLSLLHDETEISEELRERYIDIALDRSERLEDLINEFFDITRFNFSDMVLELSHVNLTRMMEQIVFEFHPVLEEKNLTIDLSVAKDMEIVCDVDKLERVFDNLIRNAINYCYSDSTIQIHIEEEEEAIRIVTKNPGRTIPKEKLSCIFDQFFRLDSSRQSSTGGAGLGLAISKKIVELHNGTIHAESENEEIRFIIVLPKKNMEQQSL